jgi:hypothetical protein
MVFVMLNDEVLRPMPRASVSTATAVKPGDLARERRESRKWFMGEARSENRESRRWMRLLQWWLNWWKVPGSALLDSES